MFGWAGGGGKLVLGLAVGEVGWGGGISLEGSEHIETALTWTVDIPWPLDWLVAQWWEGSDRHFL